jgi:GT2 family glycosyltransferase
MPANLENASISVAIASKGRPEILDETLESLSQQTFKPRGIVIVVPSKEDLPKKQWGDDTQYIVGPHGSSLQRNKALDAIPMSIDYVAFFDDDCEFKSDFLEQAVRFMQANPSVAACSGFMLADGNITRLEAQRLISDFQPEKHFRGSFFSNGRDHILHGCNMIIRRSLLEYEMFDEDLPYYSYAEDYDISVRLKRYGIVGRFSGCIGVHLQTPGGRVREIERGYSLVANNWHFLKKGTAHRSGLSGWARFWLICVGKNFGVSFWNFLKRDRTKDWVGRMKGILLAVGHIFQRRSHPGRIREL